jgi:hypothetical protein
MFNDRYDFAEGEIVVHAVVDVLDGDDGLGMEGLSRIVFVEML